MTHLQRRNPSTTLLWHSGWRKKVSWVRCYEICGLFWCSPNKGILREENSSASIFIEWNTLTEEVCCKDKSTKQCCIDVISVSYGHVMVMVMVEVEIYWVIWVKYQHITMFAGIDSEIWTRCWMFNASLMWFIVFELQIEFQRLWDVLGKVQ